MDFSKIINIENMQPMTPEEIAAHDREIEQAEEKAAAEAKQERYEKSGVPPRYWPESFDTYKVDTTERQKAASVVTQFVKDVKNNKPNILVLLGPVGTGKTHLVCAALREIGGQYMTAAELVEEIRHTKAFNANLTEKQIVDKHAKAPVSVLDEVGRGINATDEKYTMYLYINALYNLRGSALITSNYSKSEFLNYVGAAVADRLVEYGSIIEIGGESYRRELRRSNDHNTK
ncbi:MAG: ATP-binding protein [Bacteroidales bacterium]|nr:ATP-binding protein [Bacteroidales bacterium]